MKLLNGRELLLQKNISVNALFFWGNLFMITVYFPMVVINIIIIIPRC
jgi:hypothetical protein